MKRKLAWVLATWFGCGLSPVAPGTVGTLGTLPLWYVLRPYGPRAIALAALVVTVVGIWASNEVVEASGQKDPQRIVIDESAGVLIALTAAGTTPLHVTLAVVLFRLFDMTKPFPARRAERLPRGWGVMMDDVAAGLQAAAVVLAVRWWL